MADQFSLEASAKYLWFLPVCMAIVGIFFYTNLLPAHEPASQLILPEGFKAVNYSLDTSGQLSLTVEQKTGKQVHYVGLSCSNKAEAANPWNIEVYADNGGESDLTQKTSVFCEGFSPTAPYYYGNVFIWYALEGEQGFSLHRSRFVYNGQ